MQNHQHDAAATAAPATIGTATQKDDGTIVLQLRATGAGGMVGDGRFEYAPTNPQYRMIQEHVGPIPKGGSVPVKPFPETR